MEEKRESEKKPRLLSALAVKRGIITMHEDISKWIEKNPGKKPTMGTLEGYFKELGREDKLNSIHSNLLDLEIEGEIQDINVLRNVYEGVISGYFPEMKAYVKDLISKYMAEKFVGGVPTTDTKEDEDTSLKPEEFEDLVPPSVMVIGLPDDIREEMVKKVEDIKKREFPLIEGFEKSLKMKFGGAFQVAKNKKEALNLAEEKLDIIRGAVKNWIFKRRSEEKGTNSEDLYNDFGNIVDEETFDELHEAFLDMKTVTKEADQEKMKQQYAATLMVLFPRIGDGPVKVISEYMAKKYGKEKLP